MIRILTREVVARSSSMALLNNKLICAINSKSCAKLTRSLDTLPVGLSQQSNRVDDPQAQSFFLRPIANLQQTTGIRSGYDPRARLLDMLELTFEQLLSHIWLDDIISSSAAATPRSF